VRYNRPVPKTLPVYLEVGRRRVFAGALDRPGWCRSGRDEDSALESLLAYGPRYAAAVKKVARGFTLPEKASALDVVERLRGDATTDFGAPAVAPSSDRRPLNDAELVPLTALLRACWAAFDASAKAAASAVLRKGPRGGGRDLDHIVAHVRDAEGAYLGRLGGKHPKRDGSESAAEMKAVRKEFLDALAARAGAEPLPPARRSRTVWVPRYGVRRSAWHALDHAWEIEDRAKQ